MNGFGEKYKYNIIFTNSKMSRVTFSDNIKIFNKKNVEKLINYRKIKRKKTSFLKNKISNSYCQKKANIVANRIEIEVKNPKLLDKRQKQEIIAEQLLIKHKFYNKVNKVYRLTNSALKILTERLLYPHNIIIT